MAGTLRATIARARNPVSLVPGFLKLPADLYLGEVAGVAVNSRTHFRFSRGSTTALPTARCRTTSEFNSDGYFREIGHNLYAWSFAHSVKIDRDDNIGCRQGSDMVIEFPTRRAA
jgi:hypothetical protein